MATSSFTRPAKEAQLDPGSAHAEYIKSLAPSSGPAPTFSTMVLTTASQAVGIKKLRPGFSWNEQMDQLWALGLPDLKIIVDDGPFENSKQALAEFFEPGSNGYCMNAIDRSLIISRRLAFAFFYEAETEDAPFDLSEEEFLKISEPRDLDSNEVKRLIKAALVDPSYIEVLAYLLEALCGSELVLSALVDILCEETHQSRPGRALARPIGILCSRVSAELSAQALERAAAANLDEGGQDLLKGDPYRRGSAADVLQNAEANQRYCHPTKLFDGPPQVGELVAKRFKRFDLLDAERDQLNVLTTINLPDLLPTYLEMLGRKETKAQFEVWFKAHAETLAPRLHEMSPQGKLVKAALALVSA